MAEHTPGPWYYGPSFDVRLNRNGEYVIQGSNEVGGGPILPILGRTHNFPNNAEANARLIASAPDLLAALKQVNKLIAEASMTGFNYADGDWAERLFLSQQDTSSAIRKAEGRS